MSNASCCIACRGGGGGVGEVTSGQKTELGANSTLENNYNIRLGSVVKILIGVREYEYPVGHTYFVICCCTRAV